MKSHILPFAEPDAEIRLMFGDEAAFGRISEPARCWAPSGIRPVVPCQMVREYMQVYGAVDPISGDSCSIVAPKCNTNGMNVFLEVLSKEFSNDYILFCLDNAAWHKSKTLKIPQNIRLFYLPPRTPEMNPIEQVWPEVRHDFKNKLFNSLTDVMDQLCLTLNSLTKQMIKSITARDWILRMF